MTTTVLRGDALSAHHGHAQLRIGLPWMRSLPLASIRELTVTIDGREAAPLHVIIEGRSLPLDALRAEPGWWHLQDRLPIELPSAPDTGQHDIVVTMRLTVPYLDVGPAPLVLPFRAERRLTLNGTAARPTVSRDVA